MAVMTDSQFIAGMLKGYGVTHVFFVPGILRRALVDMEELGITRVLCHSEVAATYMADGYARGARRPGVVFAQTVGASNVATGLRDAYQAYSPAIAFTGGTHPDTRYRHQYQQIEDFNMFDPVTKMNVRVEKTDRLPDLVRQAFREATTGAPRPVHLELPGRAGEGVQGEGELELIIEEEYSRIPALRPEPDKNRVDQAVSLLAAAQRPVIVVGSGVIASDAGPELTRLAELLSIPVVTSLNGKAAIPNDNPLYIGIVGAYSRACANRVVAEADLVFFAGSGAGSMVTNNWKLPRPGTTVIQMDINPAEIGRNFPAKVGLVGDAKVTLQRMIEAAGSGRSRDGWVRRAQAILGEWRESVEPHRNSDAVPMRPERICKEIEEFLPDDGVVVACTSHAAIWSGTMIDLKGQNHRYIRCAGTLGWGFPGAIGVKCALPDKPLLAFTGDGGIFYHVSELETMARVGINLVVLVNNNAALGQTQTNLFAAYGDRPKDRAHELWHFRDVNFARVAEEMGCLGIRVTHPSELKGALETAFAANRPAVIDAVSDRNILPAKAWG